MSSHQVILSVTSTSDALSVEEGDRVRTMCILKASKYMKKIHQVGIKEGKNKYVYRQNKTVTLFLLLIRFIFPLFLFKEK